VSDIRTWTVGNSVNTADTAAVSVFNWDQPTSLSKGKVVP
jgi:hypothetical protein